jgi:hypothetical protein
LVVCRRVIDSTVSKTNFFYFFYFFLFFGEKRVFIKTQIIRKSCSSGTIR